METIITYNGKPIFCWDTSETPIDFFKIAKAIDSTFWEKEVWEFMWYATLRGQSIKDFLKDNNVIVWKWNTIRSDFYEIIL